MGISLLVDAASAAHGGLKPALQHQYIPDCGCQLYPGRGAGTHHLRRETFELQVRLQPHLVG